MSASSEPFLEAIRAAPDDDAPRLIYADWLDERGSPAETARAAFVRCQCAAARLPETDPARFELDLRAEILREKWSDQWTVELASAGGRNPKFERGLVVGCTVDEQAFLANGDELLRRFPDLREVELRCGVLLDDVLKHPATERVVALDCSKRVLRMADLGQIATSRLPRLKRLRVPEGYFRDSWMTLLGESERLPQLVDVEFSGGSVSAGACLADLANTPLGRRIERLALSMATAERPAPNLDDQPYERLAADAEFPRLRELVLSSVAISDAVVEDLAKGPLLGTVERLELSSCGLDSDGATRLASSPRLARCTRLGLPDNRLRAEAAAALASGEALRGLKRLDLSGNRGFGPDGVATLVRSPRWTELESLRLARVGAGYRGAEAIATSPHLSRLVELNLRRNTIGPAGAEALARSTTLASLQSLDLGGNPLHETGVGWLAGVFGPSALGRLQRLAIDDVQLGMKGTIALAASVALPGLRELDLRKNTLPADRAEAIVDSSNFPHLLRVHSPVRTVVRRGL